MKSPYLAHWPNVVTSLNTERDRDTPARRQSQRSPLESARSDEEAQRPRSGQAGEPLPRGLVAPLEEMYFQPEAESAICVQSFDDSLNSAIRTTYRISLRSSSLFMPRYPSTRVVYFRDTLKRTSARVIGRSIAQPNGAMLTKLPKQGATMWSM